MTMTVQEDESVAEFKQLLEIVTEAFGGTADVGDSEEFEYDGWTVTAKVVADEERSILDSVRSDYDECIWGRLEWAPNAYRRPDHYERPEGFTGNAERIDRHYPGVSQGDYAGLWWEPPKEGPKRGTPEFEKFRSDLCELLTYGFAGVVVEVRRVKLTEPCPTCGGHNSYIDAGYSALWGIEAFAGEYFLHVIAECIQEAIGEATKEES